VWPIKGARMKYMTIGKLAKAAGIGIETIRFYEREGLIEQPDRVVGSGYRQYPPDVVQRITFIKRAKELGFSLREIKEFLFLRARTKSKCASVRKKAEQKIADVDEKIADLTEIKRALEQLISTCHAEAPTSECPILEAFEDKAV
jgi:MerR family transcriptional regulator, copper efflux regulator